MALRSTYDIIAETIRFVKSFFKKSLDFFVVILGKAD